MVHPARPPPDAASRPSAHPTETGRIYLEDPKKFYRLLDALLTPEPASAGQPPPIERCVREFFESVRRDTWLRGAVLYEERRGRFILRERFGEHVVNLPDPFPADHPGLGALHACDPCYLPMSVSPDVWPVDQPAAAVLITENRVRHVLLLLLGDQYERAVADFVLNTLRAVLSARILQNRWRNALTEAAEIQRDLLPTHPPLFEGFDIAGLSVPADEVGGDFFDFLPFDDHTLGFVIGDVSGHGLPAALVARDVLVGLRMGVEKEMKATHVLSKLNGVIGRGRTASFVSAFYGELERDGTIFFVNAGHTPPIHVGAWRATLLTTGDPVLGPVRDVRFKRSLARLDEGDVLVLVTDGIVERQDAAGEIYGESRLEDLVRRHRNASAEALLCAIFEATSAFGGRGPWEDDATVLVIRRPPGPLS